jgi:protein DGCR14
MFSPDADVSPYHAPQLAANKSDTPAKEAGRVVHASTRLPEQSEEVPSVPPSPTRSRIGAAISGTPYHRKVDDTPKVSGYGFVDALPSPSPSELGPDAMKELMTWGTLLATPRVINNEDDGVPPSTSSTRATNPFTIAKPSSRDAIGRKLGSQASRSLREKAALLSSGVVGVGATPGDDRKRKSDMPPPAFTPRRSGVANADMLSPAARTLLGRTKSGGALGLSPRPPSTPAIAIPSHTLRNKSSWGGKEVDLSKVGWSPLSTPVSRSRRDR